MNKPLTKLLILLSFLLPGISYSQTTLIYFEDFENTDTAAIHLNVTGVGTPSGSNQWVINRNYVGQPVYPNTISQDSTFGGLITHSDSNYLHIRDINTTTVSNANFNPNTSSDRFTRLGSFCTLGHRDVRFAFFYLVMGNANSYGQVYYKANGGAWTLANVNPYSGTYKWKYDEIINPAFENIQNLQFGFRWVNGVSTDTASSFAIDDIKLVGTYDPVKYPVKIKITTLYSVPVCQNNDMLIQFTLSAPLCGQGIYQVQLSGAGGNFSNPYDAGNYLLDNDFLTQYLNVHIPSNTPADTCYKIRVVRTDISPPIYSDTSICFEVKKCPNTITTLEPVALKAAFRKDTICVYSVIDVPFLSTGVFVNNRYIAQLSDSNGFFTPPINELGTLFSSQTYPGPPGTVSGKIVPLNQPIPPGCKYKIRVVSTSPAVIGTEYGPFCIRNCDAETNNTEDISLCIPPGIDTCIPVHINMWDSTLLYSPGNHFKVEVRSSKTFASVNRGKLGNIVMSEEDTCLQISIPDMSFLSSIGMAAGMYYMRIISDSASNGWDSLGTLIRITIGFPNPTPLNILYLDLNTYYLYDIPDTSVCTGETMFYLVDPYNSESEYAWTLNNNNNWPGSDGSTGIIFNGTGDFYLSAVETNYGCTGPGSDTVHIKVRGTPSVTITGPPQVCVGDTVHFSVPLENETYYTWSSPNGTILDTANNNLTITFKTAGSQQVSIHAVGECGVANGSKTITVRAYPLVNAGNDTLVCQYDSVNLSTTSGTYTYLWSNGATTRNITVAPDTTTTYVIASKVSGTAGCTSFDTVTIYVRELQESEVTDSICPDESMVLDPGVAGAKYIWSTGETTQAITINDSGLYILKVKIDTALCNAIERYAIDLKAQDPPLIGPDTALCTGNTVVLDAGINGSGYSWNTSDTTKNITVKDTGTYTVTVDYANGKCSSKRIIHVAIEDCLLDFKNVITPNDDGKNDYWFNTIKSYFPVFKVRIWNRWGELVYESSDSQFHWDGKNMNGKRVSDGVYYYIVSAGNSMETQELHGFVTVVDAKK